jgi:hypothetical protein
MPTKTPSGVSQRRSTRSALDSRPLSWPRPASRTADLARRPPTSSGTQRESDFEVYEAPDRRIWMQATTAGTSAHNAQNIQFGAVHSHA